MAIAVSSLFERRGMRLDVAVEFLLRLFEGRHVDGETGLAIRQIDFMDVEGAHGAAATA